MKKNFQAIMAFLCNVFGTIMAVYIGGVVMLLHPVQTLYGAFMTGTLDLHLLAICALKIILSTTVAGTLWCIGYIGCNYFKGTEEPNWKELEQTHRS